VSLTIYLRICVEDPLQLLLKSSNLLVVERVQHHVREPIGPIHSLTRRPLIILTHGVCKVPTPSYMGIAMNDRNHIT
jgi:hypothetical protein